MLSHMDQQCLFKSGVHALTRNKHNPTYCLHRITNSSSWVLKTRNQHKVPFTGNRTTLPQAHFRLGLYLLPWSFTASRIFPMKTTTKFPPNLKLIHSSDAWFDTKVFLHEYVHFLLLFNPVARREALQKSTLWMKPQMCLDINHSSSSPNSSSYWCLTPAISEWL